MYCARDTDATRLGQSFQSRGHIDPVAVDIFALDNDVTDVNPDTQLQAMILGRGTVALL